MIYRDATPRARRTTTCHAGRRLLAFAVVVASSAARANAQSGTFTVDRYADVERVSAPQISPDGNHVVFRRAHVDVMTDAWVGMLWEMDADGSRQRQLVAGSDARWSPDGSRIAYLAPAAGRPQIWVRYMDGEGAVVQVTRGDRSPVSFRWSPDGRSIAFAMPRPDTAAWRLPPVQAPAGGRWTPPALLVDRRRYHAEGDVQVADGRMHLFVVPVEGGMPREVTSGAFDIGANTAGRSVPPAFSWLPDGRTLIADGDVEAGAGHADRTSAIVAVDVATGAVRRLTTDTGFWHAPVVSPDGKWIAFTGFTKTHDRYRASDLMVMHPDGSGLRDLTAGIDRDPESVAWGDNETLYFTARDHGASNVWLASLTAKAPATRAVSNGEHVIALGSVSIKGNTGVATRTAPQQPAEIVRFTFKKAWDLQPLTHVNDALLAGLQLGDVEEIAFSSAADTKGQGWLVKPPGFDPTRKYPLIVALHDGIHTMADVGFHPSFQNDAAAGFLVFYLNPRGSAGYGSTFGNASSEADPGPASDDVMAGVNDVISRGSVDTTRMFVGGAGDGGRLAAWVIGHTTRFAAAALGNPVTDWISFAGQSDVPRFVASLFPQPFWTDPAPWLTASPITYAGSITTPTLIMTGDTPRRPSMAQGDELYAALSARDVAAAVLRFAGDSSGADLRPSDWIRTQLYTRSWYDRHGPVR